jgi:hypothetical protein
MTDHFDGSVVLMLYVFLDRKRRQKLYILCLTKLGLLIIPIQEHIHPSAQRSTNDGESFRRFTSQHLRFAVEVDIQQG